MPNVIGYRPFKNPNDADVSCPVFLTSNPLRKTYNNGVISSILYYTQRWDYSTVLDVSFSQKFLDYANFYTSFSLKYLAV